MKKGTNVLLLILGLSAFSHVTDASPRRLSGGKVIGGRDAVYGEFPYQVSLQWKRNSNASTHACGGSIIDKYHIITAAHCLNHYSDPDLVVVAGILRVGFTEEESRYRVDVAKSYKHEKFDYSKFLNDIALIRINGEFPLGNAGIATILLRTDPLKVPTTCTVSGWGSIVKYPAIEYTDILQALDVPYVTQDECVSDYKNNPYKILSGMICAGYAEGEKDACGGDSGGPLVCDGQLSGVVSWGKACALANYPGVYTDVAYYHDWIETTLATSYKDGGLNQSQR